MKSSQTVALVVVVVGLVFVITFVSQWSTNEDRPAPGPVTPVPPGLPSGGSRLHFPVTVLEKQLTSEMKPVTGSHDFWFKNPTASEVAIGGEYKSCKCSKVEVLQLTPEEEKIYQESYQGDGARHWLAAQAGVVSYLASVAVVRERSRGFLDEASRWQLVEDGDKKPIVVPAGGTGLVRMSWEGKQEGPQLLTADLSAESPTGGRELIRLQVPVQFVLPLLVSSRMETLPAPLQEGSKGSVSFVCFSMTRSRFDLTAREVSDDPCFECKCTPLTRAECRQLLEGKPESAFALSGYRVVVTVHERIQGKQLDLGPFLREIELTSEALLVPLTVKVGGEVQGEVRIVVPAESRNRIRLGDFLVDRGTSVTVKLQADQPGMMLALDSKFPDFLEVTLEEQHGLVEGKKQWSLSVRVPPNRAFGLLPPESGIVLKTLRPTPRGIRIPVSGHGTVK